MNAYTLVDSQTRKKLDEMLKTWKEPVPGSLDPRPVFPAEITRSIENALIKARTAALQQQQSRSQHDPLNRSRGTTPPSWRNTPTPPQPAGRHAGFPNGQQYVRYSPLTSPVTPLLTKRRSPSNHMDSHIKSHNKDRLILPPCIGTLKTLLQAHGLISLEIL